MRVGTVCYATDQGLGMLAKWYHAAGVIQEVLLFRHSKYENHPEWYPGATYVTNPFRGPAVDAFLEKVDAVLFFETPFDWKFPDVCRKRGIRTIMMPMYEWSLKHPPHHFDKYLCPSQLDVEYFPDHPFVPVPVDPSTWKLRTHARRFLHNAGHIGHRHHKGTEELIQAIPYIRPDVQLTIRCQSGPRLNRIINQNPFKHPGVKIECGNLPYGQLFEGYDVYVAPEKFNGLSLPLQEARAAGLMVMASDRFPANTYLPHDPLIPVSRYYPACIASAYFDFQEAVIEPQTIAETINEWAGEDITEYSLDAQEWAELHSWSALKDRILQEIAS